MTSTNLTVPFEVPIDIKTNVTTRTIVGTSDALKSFVDADTEFMSIYNYFTDVEKSVETDQNLWKILNPTVRISETMHMHQLPQYALLDPLIADFDLTRVLCRPGPFSVPAPKVHKPKKYFLARNIPVKKVAVIIEANMQARKFVSQVERVVKLD